MLFSMFLHILALLSHHIKNSSWGASAGESLAKCENEMQQYSYKISAGICTIIYNKAWKFLNFLKLKLIIKELNRQKFSFSDYKTAPPTYSCCVGFLSSIKCHRTWIQAILKLNKGLRFFLIPSALSSEFHLSLWAWKCYTASSSCLLPSLQPRLITAFC